MIQSVKQAIALVSILVTLATWCWYYAGQPASYRLDSQTLASLPDHQITALEVRQFNAQGQLIHRLTTPYLHHIPKQNQHWAKTPSMQSITPGSSPWAIQAHEATAYHTEQTQHGVYRGQVVLDHGNTHVRAHSATTESDANNQLILATALGHDLEQAHVWVGQTAGKLPLHAYADRIRYEPQTKRIVFNGHARLIQGDETFTAPEIIYDLKRQQLVTHPHISHRTEIVIHSTMQRVLTHE